MNKSSISVKAAELRMMTRTPEAGMCTSTYFYGLRFSWDCGRKKGEKNKETKNREIASGETSAVLLIAEA